jgi:hypothetical protein
MNLAQLNLKTTREADHMNLVQLNLKTTGDSIWVNPAFVVLVEWRCSGSDHGPESPADEWTTITLTGGKKVDVAQDIDDVVLILRGMAPMGAPR